MELPNHLVPWHTVKKLLKGAWDEGYDACAHYHSLDTEHSAPNPYQEDD